jgi:alkanesulfonate monooxygenase SsuD/methylene tetrahydromethanopterin reductase-like flavin-dependent oxidoreductase (luciferase family)
VLLGVHVVCADTEEEARRQLAPVHVMDANLARGDLQAPIPAPDEAVSLLGGLPPLERYRLGSGVPPRFVGGTPDVVREVLDALVRDLGLDGLIAHDVMTDRAARVRSYELLPGGR